MCSNLTIYQIIKNDILEMTIQQRIKNVILKLKQKQQKLVHTWRPIASFYNKHSIELSHAEPEANWRCARKSFALDTVTLGA